MNSEELFNSKVGELKASINSFSIKTEEDYKKIISEVLNAKISKVKTPTDYRRLKRYDVLKVGQTSKLISPINTSGNNNIKYYVHNSELYEIIKKAHIETRHGGIHKLEHNLKKKYVNITREIIKIFLENCQSCLGKRAHPKKRLVVKPVVFNDVTVRAQVDLIDFQKCPDGNYNFILNYQDHVSKFVNLRALKSKTASEVANHLVDIFCIFGAPSVLQSDDGREFVNSIIEELKCLWPELIIVHGEPRHSQSQDNVERANRDIEDMIVAWMEDNKSKNWSEGLRFCQFQKNNSFHSGNKQSAFEVMFGRKAKLGLATSNLPKSIAETLSTEEELENALNSVEVLNGGQNDNENESVNDTGSEDLIKEYQAHEVNKNSTFELIEQNKEQSKEDVSVLRLYVVETDKVGQLSIAEIPEGSCKLRTVSNKQSKFRGQGFVRCNCYRKCVDGKCRCRRYVLKCNSKCHKALDCANK